MNFTLCIPTYNSEEKLRRSLPAIKTQTLQPQELWVIDSSSIDQTVELAKSYGFKVQIISQNEFNHGRTRNLFRMLSKSDIYLYLTDDAIPADEYCFEKLLKIFDQNSNVGLAYGRQLPHLDATVFAAHARLFNYPNHSVNKSLRDSNVLGIKTPFCSNSFAAYRSIALDSVNGFPDNTILSEDTYVAAKMILNNWLVSYVADARVFHSHNYSIVEEFKRYFDIGVFYGREKWIKENFGSANGEGKKYVLSELRYLKENHSKKYMEWFLRNGMKWLGYRLGSLEKIMPVKLIKKLSMHKAYWRS